MRRPDVKAPGLAELVFYQRHLTSTNMKNRKIEKSSKKVKKPVPLTPVLANLWGNARKAKCETS